MELVRVCAGCDRGMRPQKADPADYPAGTPVAHGRGLCLSCHGKWRRGTLGRTTVQAPPVPRAVRLENLEWLIQYDTNAEAVARRAGFTNATTAVRMLQRWGRHDLATTLHRYASTDDVYHNNYDTAA